MKFQRRRWSDPLSRQFAVRSAPKVAMRAMLERVPTEVKRIREVDES